jgi:hypothetical protein
VKGFPQCWQITFLPARLAVASWCVSQYLFRQASEQKRRGLNLPEVIGFPHWGHNGPAGTGDGLMMGFR